MPYNEFDTICHVSSEEVRQKSWNGSVALSWPFLMYSLFFKPEGRSRISMEM